MSKLCTRSEIRNAPSSCFKPREEAMMSRKNAGGAPSRGSSDESVSPRCVLDDGYATSTSNAGTSSSSSSTPATTTMATTYHDPSALLKEAVAAGRRDGPAAPPWKALAVAEAWRSKAKRQLSGRIQSLGPTMSSTLRRLSIRRTEPVPDNIEVHEFCVIKPTLRTFSLAELKKATRNFSKGAPVITPIMAFMNHLRPHQSPASSRASPPWMNLSNTTHPWRSIDASLLHLGA